MESLEQIQSQFSALVHLEGTEYGKAVALAHWMKGAENVSLQTRAEIYRYAYWARIEESLIDDFPKTREAVGEEVFLRLIREYIGASPSTYSSLAEVSGPFSRFLQHHSEWKHQPGVSELARYEWELILCQLTNDGEVANLNQLTSLDLELISGVVFELSPSVRFFESRWDVLSIPISETSIRLVLFREDGEAVSMPLNSDEGDLLKAIGRGLSLGEIPTALSHLSFSADQISSLFSAWTERGILNRFHLKTGDEGVTQFS